MHEDTSSLLTRRALARNSLLGGAMTLFSGLPAQAAPGRVTQEVWNVRDCGAKGDGKSDDTVALQKALDVASDKGGVVLVPVGEYLTHELRVRPSTAIIGVPAWNYSGPGGSVLRLAGPGSKCLLNLTTARGSTIDNLSLEGRSIGRGIHGMFIDRTAFGEHEDALRVERCQVNGFRGDGLHLDRVWVYSVRHCMIAYNRGDGLHIRGWDGFILDNWLSANGRAGFAARNDFNCTLAHKHMLM